MGDSQGFRDAPRDAANIQHTPEPWEAVAVDREGDWHVFPPGWTEATVPLARIYHGDDRDYATRVRAGHNARLLAAAPMAPHECDDDRCTGHRVLTFLRDVLSALDDDECGECLGCTARALLARIEGR